MALRFKIDYNNSILHQSNHFFYQIIYTLWQKLQLITSHITIFNTIRIIIFGYIKNSPEIKIKKEKKVNRMVCIGIVTE